VYAIDTCVIIELSKKPDILNSFCKWAEGRKERFIVCTQVMQECKREKTIAMLEQLKVKIALSEIADLDGWAEFGSSMTLGDGELSTIFFCKEKQATMISFDKKAVRTCRLLKVSVIDFEEEFIHK